MIYITQKNLCVSVKMSYFLRVFVLVYVSINNVYIYYIHVVQFFLCRNKHYCLLRVYLFEILVKTLFYSHDIHVTSHGDPISRLSRILDDIPCMS